MPEFIVRAHAAPTDPERFLANVGGGAHVEYLAQILVGALFVSKGHRTDTTVTLVLERSTDFSRALSFDGSRIGDLGGLNEAALLDVIAECLWQGSSLGKEEVRPTDSGIEVAATSFEHLIKARIEQGPVYLLDRKGEDIRGMALPPGGSFVMSDHVPLSKKLKKSFVRQGVKPVSLGPVMLQSSQCAAIIQNEYDRQG
jgi:tRNA (pseudouridine54-N1)-methyltransferase